MSRPFTPEAARAILLEVRQNHAKLTDCPRHAFVIDRVVSPLRTIYRCAACDGTIDGHAFHWWSRGAKDGAA